MWDTEAPGTVEAAYFVKRWGDCGMMAALPRRQPMRRPSRHRKAEGTHKNPPCKGLGSTQISTSNTPFLSRV
jgi:hypothetical protein